MKTKSQKILLTAVEAAVMIALSTVLSTLKLVDMPYGGSVTFASMIPVAVIAYRHGLFWGLGTAGVYAVVQQLLGLENFSYLPVPTPIAIIALIVFDYLIAFLAIGLAGIFRGKLRKEGRAVSVSAGLEFMLGALLVSVIRYLCHTVAGATVWAGLPIPDGAALLYSVGYNATYMIPETVINCFVAFYLASALDFTKLNLRPYRKEERGTLTLGISGKLRIAALVAASAAVVTDVCLVFAHMQDPESGDFTFKFLSEVNFTALIIVTSVCLAVAAGSLIAAYIIDKKSKAKA